MVGKCHGVLTDFSSGVIDKDKYLMAKKEVEIGRHII
jgi:hypothetical protein